MCGAAPVSTAVCGRVPSSFVALAAVTLDDAEAFPTVAGSDGAAFSAHPAKRRTSRTKGMAGRILEAPAPAAAHKRCCAGAARAAGWALIYFRRAEAGFVQ